MTRVVLLVSRARHDGGRVRRRTRRARRCARRTRTRAPRDRQGLQPLSPGLRARVVERQRGGRAVQVGETLFEAIMVALRVAAATRGARGSDDRPVLAPRRVRPHLRARPHRPPRRAVLRGGGRLAHRRDRRGDHEPCGSRPEASSIWARARKHWPPTGARRQSPGRPVAGRSFRSEATLRCPALPRVTAGRSVSPTTMLRRSTGRAPWSRSHRGDSLRPARRCVGGAPAARSFTTFSTPAQGGRP